MSVDDDALSIQSLRDIDRTCLAFEEAWRAGRQPSIERYLGDVTGRERAALLQQLLLLDLDYQRDEISAQEYAARFPDDRQTVAAVFAQVRREATRHGDPAAGSADEDDRFTEPRYQIVRHLARGGLGDVFVAHDRQLNREVALKELQHARALESATRARFLTEAEVTGVLEHPGVAPVHSLERHPDGRLFYAMRLVHGTTLKETIAAFHAAKLTPGARAIQFRKLLAHFVDVCETIDYAHSRGILHRDLKPANIMLGRYGETIVVDWGLAKTMDTTDPTADGPDNTGARPVMDTDAKTASTQAGVVMGTPAFMSPEQARGDTSAIGPPSDIYSLGATLFALLTGQSPYQDDTPSSALTKVRTRQCPSAHTVNSRVPHALSAVCSKAMAFRPSDRYDSARTLAHDIEAWLADEPVTAYRDGSLARAARWARRHPTGVGTVLAGITVALIGLAIGIATFQQKNEQLRTANQRTLAANQQARRHFRRALDAIEGYYQGVSGDLLLRGPESTKLRQRLLQFPLRFYQQLRQELEKADADDPESRAELAHAYYAIATITFHTGVPRDALYACRQSAEILEPLLQQFPDRAEYRTALSATYNRLGIIQHNVGAVDLARRSLTRAVELVRVEPSAKDAVIEQQALLARSYNNLALLAQQEGDFVKARSYLEDAIAVNTKLLRAAPGNRAFQNDLAKCEGNLGLVLTDLGHADQAEAHHARAIELDHALVAAEPTNADYVGNTAAHYYNLATLQFQYHHDPATAQRTLKHALTHDEWLVGRFPNVASFRSDSLIRLNFAGTLARQLSDRQLAIEHFERAIAVGSPLVEIQDMAARSSPDAAPDDTSDPRKPTVETSPSQTRHAARIAAAQNATILGGAHCNLGQLLKDTKSLRAALAHFDQAIAILTTVVAIVPRDAIAMQFLRNSYWSRAATLDSLGEHARAAAAWKKTIELDDTKRTSVRICYAKALARTDDHDAAVTQCRDIDFKTIAPRLRYETARVFALAANAAHTDESLSAQQRDDLVVLYVDRAVAILRDELGQRGYLASVAHRTALKNDADFVPLHQHAEWKTLIAP